MASAKVFANVDVIFFTHCVIACISMMKKAVRPAGKKRATSAGVAAVKGGEARQEHRIVLQKAAI